MVIYEYKVVPAPDRAKRAKGVRGTGARFANTLELVMNQMGAEGWEYQRTDTLPCEARSGLTGRSTVFQNMLIFRRSLAETVEPAQPAQEAQAPAPVVEEIAEPPAVALPELRATRDPEDITPAQEPSEPLARDGMAAE